MSKMVRIYFEKKDSEEKDPQRFVDINIWSLVKANILSSLLIYALFLGVPLGIGIIWGFFGS